jgi:putative peptide modification system cyclase
MDTPVGHPPQSDPASVTPMLRTVVLADLADSTQFIERLGDAPAAALLQRLDLQIRDLLVFTNGRLIDKADGLLALFERPVQAVDFALRYQHALRDLSADVGMELKARIGIHVGDVMTWVNTPQAVAAGAKPLEVEGLAKPVAARLMSLAMPGQILMSGMAQTLAHRAQSELGERATKLRWLVHGRYRFKGVPAPMIVHEVGEAGFSPLRLPPSGQKSWREVPLWRRPPVLAVEVLCVIGVLGGTLYTTLRSPPALAFGDRDWVVVGDVNNFTGDSRLDESLETAFRISLEQSRYVNLVSDIKVRDALSRMGRDPKTIIDRSVGSEIALREGARALLLPSVAEVGGQLRVNLEVVDPTSQVTVYAESAEGRGQESALASIDSVNGDLRRKLGEAMGDIKANGKPLAQITTSSIDALRLYSLANDASLGAYKLQDSMTMLNLALAKDPAFAMAYSARARLHLANSDNAGARADFARARQHRDRLSSREALRVDASIAEMGPPGPSIQQWKLLAKVYPDTYNAYYHAAFGEAFYLQRYDQALATLRPAMIPQNPSLAATTYLSGMLHEGLEQYPAAQAAFDKFEALGGKGFNRNQADLYALQRRYPEAARILAKVPKTGLPGADLDMRLPEITYPLDRGDWRQGLAAAAALEGEAKGSAPLLARTFAGTRLGLRAYEEGARVLPDVRRFVDAELRLALTPDDPDAVHSTFAALYGATLAARLGDARTARRVLLSLRVPAGKLAYPAIDDMVAVVDAELALAEKNPTQAVALLQKRVDGGELNIVHSVLLRAYRAQKAWDDAYAEAGWLAAHRGRAYVEWNSQYLLQPANVVETNLAWLSMAEIAKAQGKKALSKQQLVRLAAAWPKPPAFVAERIKAL